VSLPASRAQGSSATSMERLMSVEEVADYLGVPVATLYQWRHKGSGPAAYRVGRYLRYDPKALRTWLQEHLAVGNGLG
jgi:excisionase family DNA binding protein